jgi:hypothetical protein
MPSPFLLNLFTTAALNATPNKSIFLSRSMFLGIKPSRFVIDAWDISVLEIGEAEATASKLNVVEYLNI